MTKRGYKEMMVGVENKRIEEIIDDYVHIHRDRKVLKLSLMHNVSYTNIAGRLDLNVSSRTVQTIMNRWMPVIMEHLKR